MLHGVFVHPAAIFLRSVNDAARNTTWPG